MNLKLEARPAVETLIVTEKEGFDLIIIGGGPAGLTAAIYALRARLNVLLIEKLVLGGLASTAYHIDNYPGFPEGISGLDLAQKLGDQAKKLGLRTFWGNAIKIKKHEVQVDGRTFHAQALIIATGTEPLRLDVPGEEAFRGKGVSYCATCDGPFYQDKNIIVVGGGNAAIAEAIFLTRFAKKVTIVHRRDELRADKLLAEQAKNHPKIYFFWHSAVEKISGDKVVDEVTLRDLLSDKIVKVPADGVFIYIGSKPNSAPAKGTVKLDPKGFIITDDRMLTSAAGVFAAGDIRVKTLRQVVTAAADGATAADSAREYLTAQAGGV
ncbi:MAG TPA: thioredoxin-disulfide reductase [Candidatus Sulfotelmatobacter sp.]|nr:thioredoxin-disulfide reductase [Candidatus Sulfotelmatobacter sp.]